MNIEILQMIDGAKKAKGLTVIIDVFRAFSNEAYLFSLGAKKIIPLGDIEKAYELKKQNPDFVLAGERHGAIMPGFDLGNSPSEDFNFDVKGKTIVHTTSAGTQGIKNATGANEILGCGLVNARATAEYIIRKNPENVSLVCMGLEAMSETEEDTLCAEYIKSIIENKPFDIKKEADNLRYTSGKKFFDESQKDVFPKADFDLCIDVDKFNFVMKLEKDENGFGYMKKI